MDIPIIGWIVWQIDDDDPGPVFSSKEAAERHASTVGGLVFGLADVVEVAE